MDETTATPSSWPARRHLALTSLTALGVVFGDIGTSPLYAFRLCFSETSGLAPHPENIFGILSLVFWAITVVITVKYLLYILLADFNGEGGVLALMALGLGGRVPQQTGGFVVALGLAGAALLYGDGMITPAISVLSAIEGLALATPALDDAIIPMSLLILIGVFAVQRNGTKRIGHYFGPIMLIWFLVIGVMGVSWIASNPDVLQAVDPRHGIRFLLSHGWVGFLVLGFVFLVVTGGEALYADLGHFGLKPIRLGWFLIAMPAILLNYFGQAAFMLENPGQFSHSFYAMAPTFLLYPLVALATLAAIIASQAVISGAFSLTYQAIQLGLMPRLKVKHYAEDGEGQVYVPVVNGLLFVSACLLVVGFRSSDSMAGAYGLAVSATMVITTILANITFARKWGWFLSTLPSLFFLTFDLSFLGANLVKLADGGWFPALVAIVMFAVMTTWAMGRRLEEKRLSGLGQSAESLIEGGVQARAIRTPGTGVFLDSRGIGFPKTLAAYHEHTHSLPERIILMTVITDPVPRVALAKRVNTVEQGEGILRVNVHYGFMQTPNLPAVLNSLGNEGVEYTPDQTTFFVGRQTGHVTQAKGMPIWRKQLYAFLTRNAEEPIKHYQLPADRVLEIGVRYRL